MKNIECTLPKEINECPFYDKEKLLCNNQNSCSFQKKEEVKPSGYVRKERWYEQYYKKK